MEDESSLEISEYRFCCLILGATIKHHISECSPREPEVIKALENDLYIDDLATGVESEDEALHHVFIA